MKTMKNFAAQQLTKKQMNDIKGGVSFSCYCTGMANAPYNFRWVQEYETTDKMVSDLNTRCENGGSCERGTELYNPFK